MAKKKKKDYKLLLQELTLTNLEKKLPSRRNPEANDLQRGYTVDLRNRATSAERRIDEMLQASDINYVFQKVIENPFSFYIVDFFFPDTNTCLELDGKYHLKLTQFKKDKKRDAYLKEQGYTVIRITNNKAYQISLKYLKRLGKVKTKQAA